jgi:hypothetical protein
VKLLLVGEAVVVVIEVGIIPHPITIGVLGLGRIVREPIKEIDDSVPIRIDRRWSRPSDHLQTENQIGDVNKLIRRRDIQRLARGINTVDQQGEIGIIDIDGLEAKAKLDQIGDTPSHRNREAGV